jgi:hypothetical protein
MTSVVLLNGVPQLTVPDICTQKKRRAMLEAPSTRLTLTSPYPEFTEQQLNMRRKAEVLQYLGNQTNSKTNGFTKREKFAQLARGIGTPNQLTQQQIADNRTCDTNALILTPSTSSDVPGPAILLYLDDQIPLYNYTPGNTTVGILNPEDTSLWTTYTQADIYSKSSLFFTLYLHNNIESAFYTYTTRTPVSMLCQGVTTTLLPITVHINSVVIRVMFNSQVVFYLTRACAFSMEWQGTSLGTPFRVQQYVGNIDFSPIRLFSQPGFIYDFYLSFETDVTDANVVINTTAISSDSLGAVLLSSASDEPNLGFVFNGVKG